MDDSALTAVSLPLAEQEEDLPFAGEAVVLSRLDYIELKAQQPRRVRVGRDPARQIPQCPGDPSSLERLGPPRLSSVSGDRERRTPAPGALV